MTHARSATLRRLQPTRLALLLRALLMGAPAAIGLATASWAPAAFAQAETPRNFDIPAGRLEDALNTLARQAGITLTFDPDLVAGKPADRLRGSMTVNEALRRLLEGSAVSASSPRPGTYTLKAAPAAITEAQTLAAVTVLGARDPNVPLSNVPASISLMTRDRIVAEQPTARGMEDLIARTVPGFNPTNGGVRQIRGRTAQVFVNGVPTNEQLRASSGSDLNLLAPDQLDMVEVSRGANSAYGFGSPGGIIALSTPRAESDALTLKTKVGTSFNTSQPGGSFQTSLYQSASRIVGDFDYHVGVSLRRDGLNFAPDGDRALDFNSPGVLSMGKESLYDVDTSLGHRLGESGTLRLSATAGYMDVEDYYESDDSGSYREVESELEHVPVSDRNYRRHHTVNLSYQNDDLGGNALKVEAVASRVHAVKYSMAGSAVRRDDQVNEYKGIRTSLTTPLDGLRKGASVSYGVDFMRNRYYRPLVDESTGRVFRFFSPDVTLDSYAPYVQGQIPFGKLRLNAGVRHERYSGEVDTAVSTSGRGDIVGGDFGKFNLTLFNAGAVYSLDAGRELYASFSQGAEISQLGRAATTAGSADRVDPEPAKSNQYEIGMRHRSPILDYTLAAFYTESDLMSSLDCSLPTEPCRPLREPREFWGLEGTLAWRIDRQWTLGGTLAWMDGLRDLENGDKRRIGGRDAPPLLLAAYLDFTPREGWRNRIQFDYRAARDRFGDSTAFGEGRMDSVFLTHLSSSFAVGKGELQIGVRNLFDEKHFSIPSEADNSGFQWIPEQGRRVSVAYSVTW